MKADLLFPRELRFLCFLFVLSSVVGLFLFIIGILALFVGYVLTIFHQNPGSLTWTLNFLAYGVLGTFVSIRVFRLIRTPEPSSPGLIVIWIGWLVLGAISLGLVGAVHSGSLFDGHFNIIQVIGLWILFYILITAQFRFLSVVRGYYGTLAPPSQIKWMNRLGRWMLKKLTLEEGHKVL